MNKPPSQRRKHPLYLMSAGTGECGFATLIFDCFYTDRIQWMRGKTLVLQFDQSSSN